MRVRESKRETYERARARNQEDLGRLCFEFAARWAELMEAAIASGTTVAGCADACGSAANTDMISGWQYGIAVNILADCWEHGEELRRWHNLSLQIGDEGHRANAEGGVLDPARLRVR